MLEIPHLGPPDPSGTHHSMSCVGTLIEQVLASGLATSKQGYNLDSLAMNAILRIDDKFLAISMLFTWFLDILILVYRRRARLR